MIKLFFKKKIIILICLTLFFILSFFLTLQFLNKYFLSIYFVIISCTYLFIIITLTKYYDKKIKRNNDEYKSKIDKSNEKEIKDSKLIYTFDFFSELSNNFLKSIVKNVNGAATPLSEEVFQIKQNVNNFLLDITNWRDLLNDIKSDKNFNNVIKLYNEQTDGFKNLTSEISNNYNNLEKDLIIINELFKKIDKTTGVIKNIASNINILSLNATVEAVRAGKYGKGFKVIADDTKKLSDDTQELLQDIVEVVSKTKGIINDLTDRVKKELHGIIENISYQKEGCTSFHNILSNYYNNFNKIFSSVSDATKNIYAHIDRINPTFQLHDVIVQELNNLADLFLKINNENRLLIENASNFIESNVKDNLMNSLIDEIEGKITTDGEVDVLSGLINKYGLSREVEVKKIETDIEFF